VHNFDGRAPDWTSGAFRRLLESVDARAFGRIVHSLAPADRIGVCDGPNRFRLPPLTAAPRRARAEVRRALGLSGRDRLAAIYLNPHFRDPRLAARLEGVLAAEGIRFHGVSEPWAARPGWRAFDADFGTIVAASDLLVSGAGAAALEQARRTGVPLLALVGDQPEQALNLSQARAAGIQARAVGVATDAPAALGEAIRALTSDAGADRAVPDDHARIHRLWRDAFLSLAAFTKENHHATRPEDTDDGSGPGNQQPGRRPWRSRRRRAQPRAAARPSARADATAGLAG
jgi:hypothetical protein